MPLLTAATKLTVPATVGYRGPAQARGRTTTQPRRARKEPMSTDSDDGRSPDSELLAEEEAAGNLAAEQRAAEERAFEARAAREAEERAVEARAAREAQYLAEQQRAIEEREA